MNLKSVIQDNIGPRPTWQDFRRFFTRQPVLWKMSFREFGKLKSIAAASMLLALSIVLSYFDINLSPTLRIGFSFLANATIGMLFGPVVGAVMGGMGDVIKFLMHPTGPFFPGYTLTALLSGLVYGVFFYRYSVSWSRCFLGKLFVNFFLNIVLNTLWSSILYGKGFWIILGPRIWKNLALLPVETILLYTVLSVMKKVYPKLSGTGRTNSSSSDNTA